MRSKDATPSSPQGHSRTIDSRCSLNRNPGVGLRACNAGPRQQVGQSLDNEREAVGQVVAWPAVELHPLAFLAGDDPEAVVLDLMAATDRRKAAGWRMWRRANSTVGCLAGPAPQGHLSAFHWGPFPVGPYPDIYRNGQETEQFQGNSRPSVNPRWPRS
jgi:hypothetical protein